LHFVVKSDFFLDSSHTQLIRYFGKRWNITIPRYVQILCSSCFSYCESLSSISFMTDSELTRIESKAFYSCSSLNSITIPRYVQILCSSCFSYCESLSSISFMTDSELTRIESGAFTGTRLSFMFIPGGTSFIAEDAFPHDCAVALAGADCDADLSEWNLRRRSVSSEESEWKHWRRGEFGWTKSRYDWAKADAKSGEGEVELLMRSSVHRGEIGRSLQWNLMRVWTQVREIQWESFWRVAQRKRETWWLLLRSKPSLLCPNQVKCPSASGSFHVFCSTNWTDSGICRHLRRSGLLGEGDRPGMGNGSTSVIEGHSDSRATQSRTWMTAGAVLMPRLGLGK
jgi:hypothetical protein